MTLPRVLLALGVALLGLCLLVLTACGDRSRETSAAPPAGPTRLELGTPATAADIARWDIDVNGRGDGLPPGRGTVAEGARVYAARCAACHGKAGEGGTGSQLIKPAYPTGSARRNVASHWPYAPPLFDYIRRTMPPEAPGSLTDADVYAVTAYLLAENGISGRDFVADATTLARVTMPSKDRFVKDNRRGGKEVK